MRKVLFAALFAPLGFFAQSNLSVTPNSSATQLAQTITGSGISVSNATLNCGPNAAGTFTYTGTNLGMTGGIILTTGLATDAAGNGANFVSVNNGNTFSDPDLMNIESQATNDVCILEFDFVPICNNINITFVFGSEEYPEYVGSSFNDGFGIFLTGPNPGGGNYTGLNIGVLPNTVPVSINNVNSGANAGYYVDNTTNPNNDIVYDGYTVPVTSVTQVVPCSTYHMKIGIADAGDQAYDSGVFVGNNAVSCTNAPTVASSATPANCGGSNGSVAATVTNYTGTVTYQWLPGNQSTATVNNLPAGTYTCIISYQAGCSSSTSQTVTATITNTGSNIALSTSTQSATCSSSSNGSASVTVTGGTAPLTYTWNTTPVQNTATANNLPPGNYQVTVQDANGCQQTTNVTVGVSNPTILQITSTQICGNQGTLTSPTGTNYQWYDPSNVIIPGATSQTYNATGISGGQYYTVTFTNGGTGCKDSVRINITQFNISFIPSQSNPCNGGNNGSLTFNPASGNTFTSFDWTMTGASAGSNTAVPAPISMTGLPGGTYSVIISVAGNPSCAYGYTTTLTPGSIPPPTVDTVKVCNGDTVNLNPNVANSTYAWYTTSGVSLGSANPLTLYPPPFGGLNINTNGAAYIDTIQSASGCKSVYKAVIKHASFNAVISPVAALKCHDDSIGKIKITVTKEFNGPINKPYQFIWDYPAPYADPNVVTANPPVPVSNQQNNLHAGTYTVVIKAGNCVDTKTITLSNPALLLNDTINGYYCPKDSLALIVAEPGHSTYNWVNNTTPVVFNNDSIWVLTQNIDNYIVWYLQNGCRDTANIRLDHPVYNAFRPDVTVNIFTPNEDRLNDYFFPFYDKNYSQYQASKIMEDYEIHIYNRWGKLVYETTSYNKPWDGRGPDGSAVPDGTYYWIVKFKSNCSTKADVVNKQGFVQLLR